MNWIKKLFFNKEINSYAERIQDLYDEIYELKKALYYYENGINFEYINHILNKSSYTSWSSIIILGKNKNSRECMVVDTNDSLFIFHIGEKRHFGYVHYKINFEKKRLFIEDFVLSEKNVGNGGLLMEGLHKIAERNKLCEIIGSLSPVDEKTEEDKARRNGFYQKHGFEISNNSIYKKLK